MGQHTLHVGLTVDVDQLLTTQPSELDAIVRILGADRARDLIDPQLSQP